MLFFSGLLQTVVGKHSFTNKKIASVNFFCNRGKILGIRNKTEFSAGTPVAHYFLRKNFPSIFKNNAFPSLKFSKKRSGSNSYFPGLFNIKFSWSVQFFQSIAYAGFCMRQRKAADIKIFSRVNYAGSRNFLYNNRIIYIHIKDTATCFYIFCNFWRTVNIKGFSSINLAVKHKNTRKPCNMISVSMGNKYCINFFPFKVKSF